MKRRGMIPWLYGLACVVLVTAGVRFLNVRYANQLDDVQRQRWAIAWIGALNSHQWAQVDPLLSDSARIDDPLVAWTLDRRAAGFYLNALWLSFPQLHYSSLGVVGEGAVVVLEWVATGIAGIPPSGLRGVSVLVVTDGTIGAVTSYFNASGIHIQPVKVP
ncbi:MAG: nuclear transport factor 2 family protein [Deltaproteobacteria bacterium]|nr:nuclear transport factor 2 family protein [Deltaproteobacteria bacterium]